MKTSIIILLSIVFLKVTRNAVKHNLYLVILVNLLMILAYYLFGVFDPLIEIFGR